MDYSESSEWIDFYARLHINKELDMTYEMSIPLTKLGLNTDKIKNEK